METGKFEVSAKKQLENLFFSQYQGKAVMANRTQAKNEINIAPNLDREVLLARSSVLKIVSPVLSLDNIYTTEATVSFAAQSLRREGIQVYGVVALCTPQHFTLPTSRK
jgi:predicted amidophosphoribosyltransferase